MVFFFYISYLRLPLERVSYPVSQGTSGQPAPEISSFLEVSELQQEEKWDLGVGGEGRGCGTVEKLPQCAFIT